MAIYRCVLDPSSNKEVELDTVLTSPSNRILLWDDQSGSPFYAGYSINRQLDAGYSGPLVAIRRSSDNAISDFGFDVNGDLDTSAISTWLGSSDGYVHVLYDQGDSQLNFEQSEHSRQLKIANSGTIITDPSNGLPAMHNATSSDGIVMYCRVMNSIQPATYFMVVNMTTYNSLAHFLDGYYTDERHLIGTSGPTSFQQYAGITANISGTITGNRLIYALFDTTSSEFGVNGASATATSIGTQNLSWTCLMAGRKTSTINDHNSIYGYFQELIIYSQDDQSANRSTIEADINSYYSIY